MKDQFVLNFPPRHPVVQRSRQNPLMPDNKGKEWVEVLRKSEYLDIEDLMHFFINFIGTFSSYFR